MFVVFNKEKINSYLISAGTVAFLFVLGFFISTGEVVQTSANQVNMNKVYITSENITQNNLM